MGMVANLFTLPRLFYTLLLPLPMDAQHLIDFDLPSRFRKEVVSKMVIYKYISTGQAQYPLESEFVFCRFGHSM